MHNASPAHLKLARVCVCAGVSARDIEWGRSRGRATTAAVAPKNNAANAGGCRQQAKG